MGRCSQGGDSKLVGLRTGEVRLKMLPRLIGADSVITDGLRNCLRRHGQGTLEGLMEIICVLEGFF